MDDDGGGYYRVDVSDPLHSVVLPGRRTRYLRQYFRHIRPGALRIGAATSDAAFAPLAFAGPGRPTVVLIKADRGGNLTIEGLPAGTYDLSHTTAAEASTTSPAIVGPDGTLAAAIPAAGVLTVAGRGWG